MFSAPSASKEKHYILGTETYFVEGEYEIISDLKVSNLQIRQVRGKTNWSKINCDPKEVNDHIEVNGPINPDTPFIVERLLDRIANNNPCTNSNGTPYSVSVYLNSGGGYIKDGYELGEVFRKNKAHTVIASGGECYSSCAAAFLGGKYRDILRSTEGEKSEGKLMFHAPYRYKSEYYGIGRADIACNAKDDELRNYMIKMLNPKDGNFLYERTMSYCSISDGWSLNKDAAELFNILK